MAEPTQTCSLESPASKRGSFGCWGAILSALPALSSRLALHLPAAAWARIFAIFSALCLIKLALLARLGKHLFEIHWRVGSPETSWMDSFLFVMVVVLGVISILRLAGETNRAGVKAVRSANAAVLGIGLLLIFLTAHSGQNNYLYPILSRLLDWSSLGPYLSLDLFFHKPFLAAWGFTYILIYYVLARLRLEHWVLHLTAIYAGAYSLSCLQELAAARDELLVVLCFGLASLLIPASNGSKIKILWVLLPVIAGLLFATSLLRFAPTEARFAVQYFYALFAGSICLFVVISILSRKLGFGEAWKMVAGFYFAVLLLLGNAHYPVSQNYGRILCLGFEFAHYFAGEVFLMILATFCALVYSRTFLKGRYWWLDISGILLIAIAFVDFRLSQVMGTRLEWNVLALGNSPKMIWRMAAPYLPALLAGLAIFCGIYVLAIKWLKKFISQEVTPAYATSTHTSPARDSGLLYAVACATFLGIVGWLTARADKAEGQAALNLTQTSPVWKRFANPRLSPDQFFRQAQALGLGNFNTSSAPASMQKPRDLNVVLVLMESSHNQHLSLFGGAEDTQPLLSKYRDRMELFPNFFSTFASSIHARFAVFTSLYPIRDYNAFTLDRVPVKSLFEILHDSGYSCSLFYSSFADFTGFRDFLKQRGIDELYDADNMPGQRKTERVAWGLREEETLGAIRAHFKKAAGDNRRFFLTYIPAAPHHPFETVPTRFQHFKAGDPDDHTPFYLNQLLYMDWVLASMIDELRDTGLLDKTLVIITDDHGELLGAHGGPIGHGWLLTPDLANAPLIIMDPENPGYQVNRTIGSQVDLLPTVLDVLRLPVPANQLYEGRSLYASQNNQLRRIYSNSYQQYGIIHDGRFTLGDRETEKQPGGGNTTFNISNEGPRTVFSGCANLSEDHFSIRDFDKFQESLLRNYSFYCSSLARGSAVASRD